VATKAGAVAWQGLRHLAYGRAAAAAASPGLSHACSHYWAPLGSIFEQLIDYLGSPWYA
jgi:hypothetical protein